MQSEIIIVPSLFFMIGYIVWVIVDGYRRRQQTRVFTEFHSKLLDRIGSAKEFAEFFSSDAGEPIPDGAVEQRRRRAAVADPQVTADWADTVRAWYRPLHAYQRTELRTGHDGRPDGHRDGCDRDRGGARCLDGDVLRAVEAHGTHRPPAVTRDTNASV
jgi:hypothetical protein